MSYLDQCQGCDCVEAYSRDQSLREGSVCMLTAVCLLADRASPIKRRANNTKTPERTRPSSQDNNGMSKLLQFPSFDFSSLFTATGGTENGQRPRSLDEEYARKVRPSPATRASMLSCVLHRAFDACMIVIMAIGCMDVVHAKSAWLTGKAVSSGENTSRCEGCITIPGGCTGQSTDFLILTGHLHAACPTCSMTCQ